MRPPPVGFDGLARPEQGRSRKAGTNMRRRSLLNSRPWHAHNVACSCAPSTTMVKNSTKYKFVPLFKQIKLSREMVKAFDEYASAGFLACAFSLDLLLFLSVCLVKNVCSLYVRTTCACHRARFHTALANILKISLDISNVPHCLSPIRVLCPHSQRCDGAGRMLAHHVWPDGVHGQEREQPPLVH